MTGLIDIGVNLAHDSFDEDRGEVVKAAQSAGIGRMIVTGTSVEDSRCALELTNEYSNLWCTAGIHPHYAKQYSADARDSLADLLSQQRVVAAGETGLDYFRDFSPRAAQREAFEAQLELATAFSMPAFLHQRDAHRDFVDILKPFRPSLPGAVAHCFTGNREELTEYLDLDLHVGITGWICDERRGDHLLDIVSLIPDDRLLLETDAPYLLPRTIRPRPKTRRNQPAYLTWVLERVAAARRQPPEEVARKTTANAVALFGLTD